MLRRKVKNSYYLQRKISNMAEVREITKIEHLNVKNYQTWKYNIKLVLMEQGLFGFINGTEEQTRSRCHCTGKNCVSTTIW